MTTNYIVYLDNKIVTATMHDCNYFFKHAHVPLQSFITCILPTILAEDMDLLFGEEPPQLELNHRLVQYGSINTTLAWKIVPVEDDCNTSHILSYRQCEQSNVDLNFTTEDEMITLSSASLRLSGELADFSLSSSSSSSQSENCPRLLDAVRFNGNSRV